MKKALSAIWGGIKKVGGAGKSAGAWVLKRGPLVASVLTGAALVFPPAAGVLKGAAALVASQSGGAADQALVEALGIVINGAIMLFGGLRKSWALARPMLTPADTASTPPGK